MTSPAGAASAPTRFVLASLRQGMRRAAPPPCRTFARPSPPELPLYFSKDTQRTLADANIAARERGVR